MSTANATLPLFPSPLAVVYQTAIPARPKEFIASALNKEAHASILSV